jgi:hypothetical protein
MRSPPPRVRVGRPAATKCDLLEEGHFNRPAGTLSALAQLACSVRAADQDVSGEAAKRRGLAKNVSGTVKLTVLALPQAVRTAMRRFCA